MAGETKCWRCNGTLEFMGDPCTCLTPASPPGTGEALPVYVEAAIWEHGNEHASRSFDRQKAATEKLRGSIAAYGRQEKAKAEARVGELEREIANARFWADEFAGDSLEEVVQNLYEYVLHWHRTADTLAGGARRALERFPPPSDEEIRARYAVMRAEISRK